MCSRQTYPRGAGRSVRRISAAVCRFGAALIVVLGAAVGPARGGFIAETNPYLIGQAPDWLDDAHVVWHDPMTRDEDADGQVQVYSSTLDGAEKVCLTCGLPGPNQVPVVQPHGEWILFHSWNGHSVKVGSPGFGGLGSDVWVMTRDGGRQTNLKTSDEVQEHLTSTWLTVGRSTVWG